MSNINPGQELREFLIRLYPLEQIRDMSRGGRTFLQKMDYDLMSDETLSNTFYSSCINYLVRRLITTAEYFRRKYPDEWRLELRRFFRNYTRYKDRDINDLTLLLSKCLSAYDSNPSDSVKAMMRKEAKNKRHCYICGEDMDYENANGLNSATIDHVWPRAMGGLSHNENLLVACQQCNNKHKKDFMDASDYHYEEIALVSDRSDPHFTNEMNRQYRVAVYARTEFTCAVCGQPAYRVGKLEVGRIEAQDSWHFLNLQAYCLGHLPEKGGK